MVAALVAVAGCTPRGTCRDTEVRVAGVCRLTCNSSQDCLRTESCLDGACLAAGPEDGGVASGPVHSSSRGASSAPSSGNPPSTSTAASSPTTSQPAVSATSVTVTSAPAPSSAGPSSSLTPPSSAGASSESPSSMGASSATAASASASSRGGSASGAGPLLWLRFDDPVTTGDRGFADVSGHQRVVHCVAASCPGVVAGRTAVNFVHFDSGTFLEVTPSPGQAMPALTVATWVRNGAGHLLERGVWNDEDGFGLVFDPRPQFGHWFGGAGYSLYNLPVTSSLPVNDGVWHHVVGIMAPAPGNHTRWDLYTDGEPVASVEDTRIITASSAPTMIGRRWNESRFFSGDVSTFQLWDRALTAAEIAALYADTLGVQDY